MQVQYFKETDENELKMDAVGAPVFNQISADLDEFLENGFTASPFLLMLYDEGRAPYSARITRDAFVAFIKEALQRFPVIGTFESYIFIVQAVFGPLSEVYFEIPGPGQLYIEVTAVSALEFDFIAREFNSGVYEYFEMITDSGDTISFSGLSGIDTQYELELLFSEMIPAGISPEIVLNVVARTFFIGEDDDGEYFVGDHIGNQLIFHEIEG